MDEIRDCKNCIHRVPILNEDKQIWDGADCDSWNCEFVSRKAALKAFNESKTSKGTWREVRDEDYNFMWFRCSNCKTTTLNKTKYCSECGSDNRGDNDDRQSIQS